MAIENPIDGLEFPNVFDAYEYAIDVVEHRIPNSVFVQGACRRFIKDYHNTKDFTFDHAKAERYLKLAQKFVHIKGSWDPPEIIYLPWQKFIFANIFGFIDNRTGERRFRIAHVEVPRGQGKSAMASQCVLYMLALDNPKGNEISCVASKTDQARIVLDSSRAMAKKQPDYLKATGVEVLQHKIVHDKSDSFVRALSSDDKSLDGLNDILVVMDELHAVPQDLFDVIYSGLSKRRDSLMLCITTAGLSQTTVGFGRSNYAKKVARGEIEDQQLFSIIYTIDEGDDPWKESSWKKANPSYGFSVDPITLAAKANSARHNVSEQASFLVKHLDMWISHGSSYFDMNRLDKCKNPKLKWEDFKGKKCFAGIDLATVSDICTRAYCFHENGKYQMIFRSYIAEAAFKENKKNRIVYDQAVADGDLTVMAGEVIDLEEFQNDFIEEQKFVKLGSAQYDPMMANQFAQMCMKKRIEMLEFKQTLMNYSEPTKKLHSLIQQGKFEWNGSALTRWCFGNVIVKPDASDNVRPLKPDQDAKIDEVVAAVMALAPWLEEKETDTVYASRGIRTV